ncbi:MAG TPA: peptidase M50 [Deltaproteobacteria bacterium]|nr:peptidase M50 [Deltaproteobacteria bacterium]
MFVSAIAFIVVFSLVVLIHEFGHFIVARLAGVKVYEFSIGFPFSPRLCTLYRHRETEFTLRLLPLGGFVSFSQEGHDEGEEFFQVPRWKQAMIMSSGSLFNVAFALVIFVPVFMVGKHLQLGDAAILSVKTVWETLSGTVALLVQILSGNGGAESLSGPVGIAVLAGKAASKGVLHLLFFSGILSMGLGIMNLLPFPALDGGQLFILLIESLFRRPLGVRTHQAISTAGLVAFMVLALFVTYRDIVRLLA